MIEAALELGQRLRICIGSSEAEQSLDNPWSAIEREQMIRAWLAGREAEIVHVPDLGDPQIMCAMQRNSTAQRAPYSQLIWEQQNSIEQPIGM